MIVNVKFEEANQGFSLTFGSTQTADDGGYERGYDEAIAAVAGGSLDALVSDSLSIVQQYAFYNAKSLKSILLPNVKTIGQYAFYASGLQKVELDSVETVNAQAFRRCTSLASLHAPELIDGQNYAFSECAVQKLVLPKFENGNLGVFYQCPQLTWADLGNAKNLATQAFAYCTRLNVLILRGNQVCTLASTSLSSTGIEKATGHVYVPRMLVESYKAAANWTKYAAQIRPLEDYTVDGTATGDLDPDKI